jgi:hypothetical protein
LHWDSVAGMGKIDIERLKQAREQPLLPSNRSNTSR